MLTIVLVNQRDPARPLGQLGTEEPGSSAGRDELLGFTEVGAQLTTGHVSNSFIGKTTVYSWSVK